MRARRGPGPGGGNPGPAVDADPAVDPGLVVELAPAVDPGPTVDPSKKETKICVCRHPDCHQGRVYNVCADLGSPLSDLGLPPD